jgi:glycosyltransferase involved in cell wall biosynthesis
MDISIVIPLLNEADSLPELVTWIDKVCQENKLSYEVIMIDDGSTDESWDVISDLQQKHDTIRGIKFRRNYGKSAALHTGFRAATGEVVITMDADLQDSPEEIPGFYKMIRDDGFDLVSGWKKKRRDPLFSKNLPSKFYNWWARRASGIKLHDFNCGIKAYKNRVVKSIEIYGDMHRFIPVIAKWAGFKNIGEKVVNHQERKYGYTKFGVERFVRGPLDLMSVMFISKYGKRPLHLFGVLGTLTFILGLVMAAIVGAKKLVALRNGILSPLVTSSPYFYIALACMIIGTQLFLTGFLGELVSRSSAERNTYLVEKEI